MAAEGVPLWSILEVNDGHSESDLAYEFLLGPDRRVFLTEALARAAVEAEVRREWDEWRAEELAAEHDARARGEDVETAIPVDPPIAWAPCGADDHVAYNDSGIPFGHRTSVLRVEDLGTAWYAVPLVLQPS